MGSPSQKGRAWRPTQHDPRRRSDVPPKEVLLKQALIDTDVFVLDLRYPRDKRIETNQRFLEKVHKKEIEGFTSIFNLLEVCGVISFSYSPRDLLDLYKGFVERYQTKILFPSDSEGNLHYDLSRIFHQIQKKQSLGDAEVSYVVDRFSDHLSCFVSWNARHFEGKIPIPVKTPEEFLKT